MDITDKQREKGIYKVTIVGSIVNFALVAFKFIAGIVGNSAAMIADAVHSLSDFITDVIVILFVRVSGKPKDLEHHYGHGKYETLAALLIGVILCIVGLGIAWNGAKDIIQVIKGETLESPGMFALIAALISIVFKEGVYRYTVFKGKQLNSDVVVANAWHHRSDAFSSIGTAVGIGGAILLGQKWTVLDPLAALVVSFFIVKTAIKLMKPSIDELMEKSLPKETEDEIKGIVGTFKEVHKLENLHTRKVGNSYAIEFDAGMNKKLSLKDAHEVVVKIENKIMERFGNKTHIMIHLEPM